MSSSGKTFQPWQEMPLHELISGKLQNGAFVQKPEKGRGLLFANVVNMYGGIHLDYDSLERLNVAESDIEQYKLNEGDILVVRSSLKREGIGQSCIARNLPETVFYDCHLIRVVPDQSKILADFLSFFWRSPAGKQDLINRSKTTTMTTINQAGLSGALVPLPPLPEQKKIAHILSTVQRAIEAQERIIQTTIELKKALMHKLFTEGLRNELQKQTEIGPIPESWATPTVESVCTIKASAMSYSQLENASNVANGVNVIGIKVSDMNLSGNEIEFRSANLERQLPEKEALKRTVPANSIVFPKRGAAIATNKKRLTAGYTVLDPNLIAITPMYSLNPRYLFHWFNTFDLKKITDPGPTPQLNKKDIAPLHFPMPPVEEQEAIASAIDSVDEKIDLHSRKHDQIQDLFRTLLHELMTAKTRVHEIEITE